MVKTKRVTKEEIDDFFKMLYDADDVETLGTQAWFRLELVKRGGGGNTVVFVKLDDKTDEKALDKVSTGRDIILKDFTIYEYELSDGSSKRIYKCNIDDIEIVGDGV